MVHERIFCYFEAFFQSWTNVVVFFFEISFECWNDASARLADRSIPLVSIVWLFCARSRVWETSDKRKNMAWIFLPRRVQTLTLETMWRKKSKWSENNNDGWSFKYALEFVTREVASRRGWIALDCVTYNMRVSTGATREFVAHNHARRCSRGLYTRTIDADERLSSVSVGSGLGGGSMKLSNRGWVCISSKIDRWVILTRTEIFVDLIDFFCTPMVRQIIVLEIPALCH